MANQTWNPENYNKSARFIIEFGRPVIELLAPKPGERILDLGCGTGILTKELADAGCEIVGLDSSPEMVEAAKQLGIDARLIEGVEFESRKKFEAVISNAALHWMPDKYLVVRRVWQALKPGGRFAAECGGDGCLRIVREGMKIALAKRGLDYKARNPWKFCEYAEFSEILKAQGFKIEYIARIDKPTELGTDGLRGWLKVFANSHTEGLEEADKEAFYDEVEAYCKPMLFKNGKWYVDYVRLRFLAVKPEE